MRLNYIKYFTFYRAFNVVKILVSYLLSLLLKRRVAFGLPPTLTIEPTNLCNLSCPECPSGLGSLTRNLGFMSLQEYKKIIDQVKDHVFYLQLFFQGEPYLSKDLSEMIKYARENKMYVSVSTNGLIFTEKNIEKILLNAPDKMIFSIDGITEETYQNYRVGGSFKAVDKSLKLLLLTRKKLKLSIPFVELRFLVMSQNEHEIEAYLKYGKEVGADRSLLKSMQVYSYEDGIKFLPKNERYRRYSLKNGQLDLKVKKNSSCFRLFKSSVITRDGYVVPCCFDKNGDYKLGNIYQKTFKQIWQGEEHNSFSNNVLAHRHKVEICRNCTEGMSTKLLRRSSR